MAKNSTESNLYKQLIEQMPIHIYWKDNQFRYLGCNPIQAENALTTPTDIIGKTDYDLYPKKEADELRRNDMEVLRTGMPMVFEERFNSKEGCLFLISQKIPLRSNKGEIIGLAGISISITERVAYEKQMQQEKEVVESTLANILNNLPGHVYWKNKDSVYQGCNLAQALSAGFFSTKEMVGKTDYEMPWAKEADILRKSDLAVMKSRETLTREEASQLANSDKVSIFLSKKSPEKEVDNQITH